MMDNKELDRVHDKLDGLRNMMSQVQTDIAILKNDKKWVFRIAASVGGLCGVIGSYVINLVLGRT